MSVPASFAVTKQLRVTFTLVPPGIADTEIAAFTNAPVPTGGQFSNGATQLQLTGLRTVAFVQSYARYAAQLDLRVYGMKQADMNALSVVLFKKNPTATLQNVVTLEAYSGNGWTQVFSGTIVEASPQYSEMPDVYMQVGAQAGYFAGIAVSVPLSYPAGGSVASAVQAVAAAMGFGFQNNGVTATIPKGNYFPGSPLDQLRSICSAANVDWYFDPNGTIVICPAGTPRTNTPVINLTPQSGLIGYPQINAQGITLQALYDPSLILAGQVQVSGSDIPAANGLWMPYAAAHQLESLRFGGMWMSTLECTAL